MPPDLDEPNFAFRSHGGYVKTSEATPEYNCIAYAAGDDSRWWWPDPLGQYYWPSDVVRTVTREAFLQAFATLGYSPCESPELEDGFEKVAIYERNGEPKHAALQLLAGPHRGRWASKLGTDIDVAHNIQGACGQAYGELAVVLRRPVSEEAITSCE